MPALRCTALGLAGWLAGAGAAWACGSMGLDDPRVMAGLTFAVFGPMAALIPLELWFLHRFGGLHARDRLIKAYLACLGAKLAGLIAVRAVFGGQGFDSAFAAVVAAELAYSAGHFAVSAMILHAGFGLSGRALWTTAAAISTAIPWLYSISLALLAAALA